MGRGRQKAKQRKVARNLKYTSPETDYRALERELVSRGTDSSDESEDFDEEYSDYEYGYDYDADDDEEDDG